MRMQTLLPIGECCTSGEAIDMRTCLIRRGSGHSTVRRVKARFLSGRQSHPARVAPAGSNCSDEGGDEIVEAYDAKGHFSDPASLQAVTIER